MPFKRRGRDFDRWDFPYPPAGPPRPVEDGLKARSKRGAIGETWWSRRFIEVLEAFHEGPRLARGRAYARRGQVIDMDVEAGEVSALVQGSRARPYSVTIGVAVLGDPDWTRVEEAMASQAVFLARLLAGEMPHEIEDAFAAAGLSLFPARAHDLHTACSCPDWENPCKHIAAVYYLLAEAFDRDPFLIFAWRGRPRERLLAELRALRGQGAGPVPGAIEDAVMAPQAPLERLLGSLRLDGDDPADEIPVAEAASRFWAGGDPASMRVELRAVAMPDAILRELGPSGMAVGGRSLEDLLAPAYRAIAAAALRIAAGDVPAQAPPEPAAEPEPAPVPSRRPRTRRVNPQAPRGAGRGPSRARLERLIEEATVDCYNDSEASTGLFEMINEHLDTPFMTTILGVAVTVTAVDITEDDQIVAICRRGRDLLRVALLELPMPDPRPGGAEWVDAYRHWALLR